ncbi:MAG: cytochrome c [Thiomicrorhabdus sp.]|nr:MAG: cytochrome c [Thiomicrorhabdus sp.]
MVLRRAWLAVVVLYCLMVSGVSSAESQVRSQQSAEEKVRAVAVEQAASMDAPKFGWNPLDILGSKHDLTALNKRAGAKAMGGVAFDDYGSACVYCHIPPDVDKNAEKSQQISGWNRVRSTMEGYILYSSASFESQARIPNEISLLCLSCHDGTMAVDRVVNTPKDWKSGDKMTLHMKINSGSDLDHCGLCHDGSTAHHLNNRHIGTDLRRNHPVSIRFPGMDAGYTGTLQSGFKTPRDKYGFDNGVRLFNGFVECASCHNVHDPSKVKFLRVKPEFLCITCHYN